MPHTPAEAGSCRGRFTPQQRQTSRTRWSTHLQWLGRFRGCPAHQQGLGRVGEWSTHQLKLGRVLE
eukprot:8565710-Alexandrium_andersonii.AAC.1